ncbi:diphosphate--fructose-6-phosphate 1-phosphotransferase [Proteiniclasticum sp. C24MP]|uniref:diphosphate--fructose-6-phosphate 1-phosphotransferase n=1 Tax=Proteiniclasticum sp. C24MP TaxID=3374101 RepID=UPI0037540358
MKNNMVIIHGGGPTAVINASLYGIIKEAKMHDEIGKVFGVIGGTEGVLHEDFKEIGQISQEEMELLLKTPGSAIGSSRYPVTDEDYRKMKDIFLKHNVRYVLLNGGNGTMDACGKIQKACEGEEIFVVGIPKTIDNDISSIDHAPGFASAAKYIAEITAEVGQDVKSLPIHVCIIESMGRNAGWITAASAAAREKDGDAPHMILVPERSFNQEAFLKRVKELYEEKGGVVVVVSEGLNDEHGESIVPPVFKTGRSVYYGDVSAYLANLVIRELGIKARNEKPGILGRASISHQSSIDRDEAVLVGRKAVQAAVKEHTGVMIGLTRKEGEEYEVETPLIPIDQVMLYERKLPDEYISEDGFDITKKYLNWLKPLLGEEIPDFINFRE